MGGAAFVTNIIYVKWEVSEGIGELVQVASLGYRDKIKYILDIRE